jgi:hypothetical protein
MPEAPPLNGTESAAPSSASETDETRLARQRVLDAAAHVRPSVWAFALYALLATVMWLPFGFRTSGLVEEWGLLWLHDRGEQLWWITEDSPLASFRLRPLFDVPFEMAYSLGSGFIWLNVIALAVLACVGLATYLLVERLAPERRAVAFVAGVLAMLYPVNEGLFTFRVLHIRLAVVLFLFALVLLWDLARAPTWWRFVSMSFLLGASLLIYQIAVAVLVLGPMIVMMAADAASLRRLVKYSALWFAAPAAVACYWAFVLQQGGTYEFETASSARRPSLNEYGHDMVRAYADQLFRAWRPLSWVSWDVRYLLIGGACGVLVAGVALRAQGSGRLGARSSLFVGLGAIALSPLGFLPLWMIVYAIHETLKVYLLSSVAVAIGLTLLLGFVCRHRTVFAVVGGALTGLAAVYALHQHGHYVALAHAQTRVLGELVQQLPSPRDGSTIVVRDHSGQFSLVWTLGPPVNFSAAVESAYKNPTLDVVLCNELTGEAYLNGAPVRECPDGRRAAHNPAAGPALEVAPEQLAIFDYDPVREMRLVERRTGTLPVGYAPSRLAASGRQGRGSLFACSPIQDCTKPPSAMWPSGSIHENFGPDASNITGFRPSEITPEGLPFRWSIARRTHTYAHLPPRNASLDLRIVYVIHPTVVRSIRLAVNGRDVPLRVEPFGSGYRARATIPGEALRAVSDDIEIKSALGQVTRTDSLGIAVTRIDVEPEPVGS